MDSFQNNITKHMRSQDIQAFQMAAKLHKAYVLVRRTNEQSIKYIGKPKYVPKRLDCKFKTADKSFYHSGIGKYLSVGGLVVNPMQDEEFKLAFKKSSKYQVSVEKWNEGKEKVAVLNREAREQLRYLPEGAMYIVDTDVGSKHYGCVMFSQTSVLRAASYLHGDYDLYGIVPVKNPQLNVAVHEERFDEKHVRGKLFFDVQHFVNNRIGVPMILHGSHEKFSAHKEDTLDVFFPDGKTVEFIEGLEAIKNLYSNRFLDRPSGVTSAW